jgi:hypothetical protein
LSLANWRFHTLADCPLQTSKKQNKVHSAELLATGEKLKAVSPADGVIVSMAADAPDRISSTIVLNLEGVPEVQ